MNATRIARSEEHRTTTPHRVSDSATDSATGAPGRRPKSIVCRSLYKRNAVFSDGRTGSRHLQCPKARGRVCRQTTPGAVDVDGWQCCHDWIVQKTSFFVMNHTPRVGTMREGVAGSTLMGPRRQRRSSPLPRGVGTEPEPRSPPHTGGIPVLHCAELRGLRIHPSAPSRRHEPEGDS